MKIKRTHIVLLALYLLAVALYLCAAVRQKSALNLSATAGGQYPYLIYAKGVATEGVTRFVGDRNRMPLLPTLLSLVYDENWDTFVARSAWFSIVSSLVILTIIAVAAHLFLPPWPAAALTLAAMFGAFLEQASFVQAELLFYGLFFVSWWLLVSVMRRPDLLRAIVAGVCVGLAYLTKASALPLLVSFTFFAVIQAVGLAGRSTDSTAADKQTTTPMRAGRILLSTAGVLLCFVLTVFPYIRENKARFGQYFYNVNSTFFMWCDSWDEALTFQKEYRITQQYPDAPPEEIPGPANYWRTHSFGQILHRLSGSTGTGETAAQRSAGEWYLFLYILPLAVVVGFVSLSDREQTIRLRLQALGFANGLVAAFCVATFVGYLLLYNWYGVIGYGQRFFLSLFVPIVGVFFWLWVEVSRGRRPIRFLRFVAPISDWIALGLIVFVIIDAAIFLPAAVARPTKSFVAFYYNESLERQSAGDLVESTRGFEGVLRLDPAFAPARLSLGMNMLMTDRTDEAVEHLSEAVRLKPDHADAHNSLGSALIRAGRTEEATSVFQRATQLAPNFATAWYNLGGTHCMRGAYDEAEAVRNHLTHLDPNLAGQLAAFISESQAAPDND